MTCIVCRLRNGRPFLCAPCYRSLERIQRRDVTTYTIIRWASDRSRRFTRAALAAETRKP